MIPSYMIILWNILPFLKLYFTMLLEKQNILMLQVMSAGNANQIISFETDFIEVLDEDFIVNISERKKN